MRKHYLFYIGLRKAKNVAKKFILTGFPKYKNTVSSNNVFTWKEALKVDKTLPIIANPINPETDCC